MGFFSFIANLFKSTPIPTWPTKNVTFGFRSYPANGRTLVDADHKDLFRKAAKEWTEKTCINLTESTRPDILVSMKGMEGNQIGYGYFPGPHRGGDIDFDSSDRGWSDELFYKVALHEIGHALGLGHSPSKRSIMYKRITRVNELHEYDISNLNDLYASKQSN